MALSDKEIKEIRVVDRNKLNNILNISETIKGQTITTIEKKHRGLVENIKALMDEKESLLRAPMSKAELLEHAKDELNKCRAEATSFLAKHLEDCQKGHTSPFGEIAMKFIFADNDKAYRLLWLFLLEKDITPIIDGFNEIGIPAAERDAKVTAINDQIEKLTAKLNNIK